MSSGLFGQNLLTWAFLLVFDDQSNKACFPVIISYIRSSGQDIENHFVDADEMIKIGHGAMRPI